MPHLLKQLLYGLFYLAFFALVGFSVYRSFLPEPNCYDRKQNQGEQGVDCGGPCTSCEVQKLPDIQLVDKVQTFSLSTGRLVFLAQVFNPNTNYHSPQFSYSFDVYNREGLLLQSITNIENIDVSERKYLFSAEVGIPFKNIAGVDLKIHKTEWQKGSLKRPALLPPKNITTTIAERGIEVAGLIKNESAVEVGEVKVITLLFDRFGLEIFAGQTIINNLSSFSEKSFIVVFPADPLLASKVDPSATKVFISLTLPL